MKSLQMTAGAFLLTASAAAVAANTSDEVRHHEAHVHGQAELNLVVEESTIHIQLSSPAMNIVGFEHAPSSHEQHEAIEAATKQLSKGDALFSFSSDAQCKLTQQRIENTLGGDDHDDHKEHDKHDEHDDHKEHDKHDEHDDHKEHGKQEKSHSDFTASYTFTCAKPGEIKQMDTSIFSAFPRLETLHTTSISPQGQSSKALTADKAALVL